MAAIVALVCQSGINVIHQIRRSADEKETGNNLKKQNNINQVQRKICRYYNKGHCKYRNKCRFYHPQNIYKVYLESGKCVSKECSDRDPKTCKFWSRSKTGCARNLDCDFLHATLVHDDRKARMESKVDEEEFKCASCKDCWKDKRFVAEHSMNNHVMYFCLDCNDWVKNKSAVLDPNWT